MENKIFLDTDFLIDFLRNKEFAISFINQNEKKFHLCMSIISLFELYYGAFKDQSIKKISSVDNLAERINVYDLNHQIVKEAGKIYAELERNGKTVEFRDILIGATALVSNGFLKTGNVKHFERIKGLKMIK